MGYACLLASLRICAIAKFFFVASQGPMGEHYEAGEFGGTDTRGVEGE